MSGHAVTILPCTRCVLQADESWLCAAVGWERGNLESRHWRGVQRTWCCVAGTPHCADVLQYCCVVPVPAWEVGLLDVKSKHEHPLEHRTRGRELCPSPVTCCRKGTEALERAPEGGLEHYGVLWGEGTGVVHSGGGSEMEFCKLCKYLTFPSFLWLLLNAL